MSEGTNHIGLNCAPGQPKVCHVHLNKISMYSENCSDCAASSPGLFPAFGAPASPGAGLFGQTGASPSNAFGGELNTLCLPNAVDMLPD